MGTYTQPTQILDVSGAALSKSGDQLFKQAQNIEKQRKVEEAALKKKKESEEKNRIANNNAINRELLSVNKAIHKMPATGAVGFDEKQRQLLSTELDEIHKLGLETIGKDNSEYIKRLSEFEAAIETMPIFNGILNKEGELLLNAEKNDGNKTILHSSDWLNRRLINDINQTDGSNVTPKFVNGQYIVEFTDPESGENLILNSTEYLKAMENGSGGLVDYVSDYTEDLKKKYSDASKGISADSKTIIQEISEGRTEKISEKDWARANKEIRDKLESSDIIIDESLYQTFGSTVGEGDTEVTEIWENSDEQKERTKQRVIDHIMNQYGHPIEGQKIISESTTIVDPSDDGDSTTTNTTVIDSITNDTLQDRFIGDEQEAKKSKDEFMKYVIDQGWIDPELPKGQQIIEKEKIINYFNNLDTVKEIIIEKKDSNFDPNNFD